MPRYLVVTPVEVEVTGVATVAKAQPPRFIRCLQDAAIAGLWGVAIYSSRQVTRYINSQEYPEPVQASTVVQ